MNKRLIIAGVIVTIAVIGGGLTVYKLLYTKKDTTNSSSVSQQTTQTATAEASDDEDVSKVVIDPVLNITENQEAQLVSSADQLVSCGYTRATTEGPYYVTGTAALTAGNLNYDNLPGTPLIIAGYVYGGENNTVPLANAKVEIWQADAGGAYHPQANGAASKYTDEQMSLRGYVMTDANGYYSFTTVYPGEYEGRARHIHVRASIDGYTSVISQIIMSLPGDAMSASEDQIARALDSSCSAPSITDVDGTDKGFYSFWLQRS